MFFFVFKQMLAAVLIVVLVRAGMHTQQLIEQGETPWTKSGVTEVGVRLQADLDELTSVRN